MGPTPKRADLIMEKESDRMRFKNVFLENFKKERNRPLNDIDQVYNIYVDLLCTGDGLVNWPKGVGNLNSSFNAIINKHATCTNGNQSKFKLVVKLKKYNKTPTVRANKNTTESFTRYLLQRNGLMFICYTPWESFLEVPLITRFIMSS